MFTDYSYTSRKKITFIILILIISLFSVHAERRVKENFPELLSGRPRDGVIRTQSGALYNTYKFRIPQGTLGATITLSGAKADLDLYLRFGSPMEEYTEADVYTESDMFNESLRLYRYDDVGLEEGYAYIDVAYMLESLPVYEQKIMKDISYTITLSLVEATMEEEIRPGVPVSGTLEAESFMIRTFPVRISSSAEQLRVDLYDSTGDLDIMITSSPVIGSDIQPIVQKETFAGNESLLLDLSPSQRDSLLYISVFDSIVNDRVQSFSMVAGFSGQAAEFLSSFPKWDLSLSDRDKALNATVELITESGGGSGTILSDKGIVLTNYHVLVNPEGGIHEDLVIAINENSFRPAVERFRARVLETSEKYDCALLEIYEGYYGRPIPENYTFPHFERVSYKEMNLGDEVNIIGYPTIGGSGSRGTINFTKGILSGGEQIEDGYVLKTDALISGGNSGGAATDSRFRLLGIPSFVIEEDTESMGYIIPLSRIPQEWFSRYIP